MLGSAAFQRVTGPTRPLRGSFDVAGQQHQHRLRRSGVTSADARIVVPNPGGGVSGVLYYKRFNTNDPLTAVPLRPEGDELAGDLPRQPAAGKLEYRIVLTTPEGDVPVPTERESVVLRFKDPVPAYFLAPHIAFMFFAVLVGIRAGLGAVFQPRAMQGLAVTALVLMTAGGMILGPIVQKYAFGAFWTGFPFGYDLTDNKTLLMWIVWVLACGVLWRGGHRRETLKRAVVVVAMLVMLAVYLIPHSLRGSELDYSALDRGTNVEETPQG
jgi:hypothetical protein